MNCREFNGFLMAYVDGELGAEQRQAFERHLERCLPCVIYLDTYEETIRLGQQACAEPDGPPPEDAPEALITAILDARRR